ncbi:hypothetical protein B0H19DRAFT_1270216 [Mycena capillaripes]|nr:hypothetical protein B0H19DRAFT_1270216 [Mycena capillaripes]
MACRTLDILRLDIHTWSLAESLNIPLPGGHFGFFPYDGMAGNFVVVNVKDEIFLVSWKARTYVLLNRIIEYSQQVIFFLSPAATGHRTDVSRSDRRSDPGQLMILNAVFNGPAKLLSYPIAAFDFASDWHPLSKIDTPTYLSIAQVTPTLVAELPLLDNEHIEYPDARMAISESPLWRVEHRFFDTPRF